MTDFHVTFNRLTLQAMVSKVGTAMDTNASNEILRHVMIQSAEGNVAMIGTDMELSAIARSNEPQISGDGVVVVPYRDLKNVASLSGPEVTFQIREGQLTVTTDDTLWILNMVDSDLFPDVPAVSDGAQPLPSKSLLRALQIVAPAVGFDESRPSLLMAYFDGTGVYATDGSRAHFAKLHTSFDGLHIPSPALKPLTRLLGVTGEDYIYVDKTEAHILFLIGDDEFATRLMEAEFPSVRASMIEPRLSTHTNEMTVSRERLKLALKRADAISDDSQGIATLSLKEGVCHVTAVNMKGARVATMVDCEYADKARTVTYLIPSIIDALEAVEDEMVTFRFSPSVADGTILIENDTAIIVILPRVRS